MVRLIRFPDVSDRQIAFVYAGDIWVVAKHGGRARQLARGVGEESFPRFSPDGDRVAFTASYDEVGAPPSGGDVYVVGVGGGRPQRLTYHPVPDRSLDWYRHDGEEWILFASNRNTGWFGSRQLFRIRPGGGLPEKLPVPLGELGSVSRDGKLAYQVVARDFTPWRGYRGGHSPRIFVHDPESDPPSRPLLGPGLGQGRFRANESHPMWHPTEDRLYFLCDHWPTRGPRRHVFNLWVFDVQVGKPVRLTSFTNHDVRFPATGPEDLVFEQGGDLYCVPLSQLERQRPFTPAQCERFKVDVEVSPAQITTANLDHTRPASGVIRSASVSPDGGSVAFEARGQVLVRSVATGGVLRMPQQSASAARYPAWSPDGHHLAYWSDRECKGSDVSEYQLVIRSADEEPLEVVIGRYEVVEGDEAEEHRSEEQFCSGYRYRPYWSPCGRRLAFVDDRRTIQVLVLPGDLGDLGGDPLPSLYRIDHAVGAEHPDREGMVFSWSGDGRWLLYSRRRRGNLQEALYLWDAERPTAGPVRLTSGAQGDFAPRFDPTGGRICFLTRRADERFASDLRDGFSAPDSPRLAQAPIPSGKETDELDGRVQILVHQEVGSVSRFEMGRNGEIFYCWHPSVGATEAATIRVLEPNRAQSLALAAPDVDPEPSLTSLSVARAADRVLVGTEGSAPRYWMVDATKSGRNPGEPMSLSGLTVPDDRPSEWRQMFYETWRTARDQQLPRVFAGAELQKRSEEWDEVRGHHEPLLADLATRWDLDFVLDSMLTELRTSHIGRSGGGDVESNPSRNVGTLGVDFTVAGNRYRIERILEGGGWNRLERSPLVGTVIGASDLLLSIDGREVTTDCEPWAWLVGKLGQRVTLRARKPDGSEVTAVVEPLSNPAQRQLRMLSWVEANRRSVENRAGCRVGYLHFPILEVQGRGYAIQQLRELWNRDVWILDLRFCSGGDFFDGLFHLLTRRDYATFRLQGDGSEGFPMPVYSRRRDLVLLINGWAASAADLLAHRLRTALRHSIRIVGTPTMGSFTVPALCPLLIDGGEARPTNRLLVDPDGERIGEGKPVLPHDWIQELPSSAGGAEADPQLAQAIVRANEFLSGSP